jgi:hypothetical protein
MKQKKLLLKFLLHRQYYLRKSKQVTSIVVD